MPETILVINTGSSSLKLGLYQPGAGDMQLLFEGLADNIGHDSSKLEIKAATGNVLRSECLGINSQTEAFAQATQWLNDGAQIKPTAIGHRVVHGGPRLTSHQRITPELIAELKKCLHFAPLHIPLALELIAASERTYPNIPQFACFDTAFHTTIPEVASRFPIPREFFDEGIHRYGFHGLSYESIVYQLGAALPSRIVIAHLGSGASLCAVQAGRSIDTTMGLTPTGGIPMATRSGDLDPGVLLYLMRTKNMDADALEKLLNHDCGLAGISGGESDMRKLEAAADPNSQLAIDIFCIAIRKTIAAYSTELGGIDLLIFSGGIGEHSARIRNTVCTGLGFIGIAAADASRVRVIPSQEDIQIARHCHRLLHP